MNPEIKAQWVAALRSGEYKQGTETLNTGGTNGQYCCLGVLCDLAVKAGVDINVAVREPTTSFPNGYITWDNKAGTLPPSVRIWAGLNSNNPNVTFQGNILSVAELNDNEVPFSRLADVIEEQL